MLRGISHNTKAVWRRMDCGFQLVSHRGQRWFFVMFLLALGFAPLVFTETAVSHSDVAPEIAEITAKLADQPNNVALLLQRGQLYRYNGKFSESLTDLEQAWLLERENRQVALERCRTLMALERMGEAEAALNQYLQNEVGLSRVVALGERAHLYARTGRADLAIMDLSEALQFYPTVEFYVLRGHLLEQTGQFDAAAVGYREGLNRLPQANVLRKKLIHVFIVQGQYPEALALIDQELAVAPVKTAWYLKRAQVLAALGQTMAMNQARLQALAEATHVLTKRPTALHRIARAKVYQALGQLEAAKQDLRVAMQIAPNFANAHDLLRKLEAAQ